MPATLADLTCDSDGKFDRFINPRVSAIAWSWALRELKGDWGTGSCLLWACIGHVLASKAPRWIVPQCPPVAPSPTPCQGGDPLPALPLHPLRDGEKYYLVRGRSLGSLAGFLADAGAAHCCNWQATLCRQELPSACGVSPHPHVHTSVSHACLLQALFLTGVYQEVMGSIHNMFGSLNTGEGGGCRWLSGKGCLTRERQGKRWHAPGRCHAPVLVLGRRFNWICLHPFMCCSTFHACSGGARGARARGRRSGGGTGCGAGLRACPCP